MTVEPSAYEWPVPPILEPEVPEFSELRSPFDEADPGALADENGFSAPFDEVESAVLFGEAGLPDADEGEPDGVATLAGEPDEAEESEWVTPFFEQPDFADEVREEHEIPAEEDEFLAEEGGGPLDTFAGLVRRGMLSAAVLLAIASGNRDETALTDRIFHARHPELGGRALRPGERSLAAEWTGIRDRLVRPLLRTPRPAAGGPPAPAGGAPLGRQRMRTQQLRDAWAADAGRRDAMRTITMLGQRVEVNARIAAAAEALGRALESAGYRAERVGGFNDRVIAGTNRRSLHGYGLAIDIDPRDNPHRRDQAGPARFSPAPTRAGRQADVTAGRADTIFEPRQIAAAATVRTMDGHPVFYWAGGWRTSPDAMHFQIDVTPAELDRGLATEREVPEQEQFFGFDRILAAFRRPTVGFEFDVHYGLLADLLPAGVTMPVNGTVLSTHTDAANGFRIKLDGPRMEIATRPFEVTADGQAQLARAAGEIRTFARQLLDGCRNATESPIRITGVTGAPRPFMHPAIPRFPVVKLPVGRKFTTCSVWAAPQATITVKLSKVAELVRRIKESEGRGPGAALSGGPDSRMGLRTEAVYRAARAVAAARRTTRFSADLEGFLILLVSYFWAGELRYDVPATGVPARSGQDYEPFGKAYLPINVKTPWSQVFRVLLDPADQQFFRDHFAVGAARLNLFRLVRGSAATLADGTRKFLPPGPDHGSVHANQATAFGGHVPTWDDLVEHALDSAYRHWGDRLMVPISHPIDVARTQPRVALELRRAGFAAVDHSKWDGFMTKVFKLTQDLDR